MKSKIAVLFAGLALLTAVPAKAETEVWQQSIEHTPVTQTTEFEVQDVGFRRGRFRRGGFKSGGFKSGGFKSGGFKSGGFKRGGFKRGFGRRGFSRRFGRRGFRRGFSRGGFKGSFGRGFGHRKFRKSPFGFKRGFGHSKFRKSPFGFKRGFGHSGFHKGGFFNHGVSNFGRFRHIGRDRHFDEDRELEFSDQNEFPTDSETLIEHNDDQPTEVESSRPKQSAEFISGGAGDSSLFTEGLQQESPEEFLGVELNPISETASE